MTPLRTGWLALALAFAGCEIGQNPDPGDDDDDDVTPPGGLDERCADDNGSIELQPGFCASVVADGLGKARQMAVTPSGDLYVAVADDPISGATGGLYALRDENDDGQADAERRIFEGGGNGVAWMDGVLYFAQNDRILRWDVADGVLEPDPAEPEVVVSGLVADGDHVAKTVVPDGEGNLFVNIGSASNACQEQNRVLHSPGIDPCPELSERAGIWRFDADALDQAAEDGERWATGLRNANAMAINPETGELLAAPNGRDQLHDNWPELYSAAEEIFLPAEELYVVEEGTDGGWPYCYWDNALGKVLAPEYGGDGTDVGRCAQTDDPVMTFPAHWAPLSLAFPVEDELPRTYRDGMFVAFHGSWHGGPLRGEIPGYQVSFVPWGATGPVTEVLLPFAWGFVGEDASPPLPETAEYRPVGLAEAPDGSIYISDDAQGRIWRVFYSGP